MDLVIEGISITVLLILAAIGFTAAHVRREPFLALFGVAFSIVAGTYAAVLWVFPWLG
jgi:hypothetical protein